MKRQALFPPAFYKDSDVFPDRKFEVHCLRHENYLIDCHAHEFTELNIVVSGSGKHFMFGHYFSVQAGDVFVIPPHTEHAYSDGNKLHVYHLLLSSRFLKRYMARLVMLRGFILFFTVEPFFRAEAEFRYRLKLDGDQCREIQSLLKWIEKDIARGDENAFICAESLALYAISLLCRLYAEQHVKTGHVRYSAIGAVIEFLDANYSNNLTLTQLAEIADMEPNCLGRLFKSATQHTPMEYLRLVRVRVAQNLLLSSHECLAKIALKAGFYDQAHFSRTFRKVTGQSPLRFRKESSDTSPGLAKRGLNLSK